MLRLCVLASGNGTNLQAIIDAISSGFLKAELTCVVSDKKEAYALKRAEIAHSEAIWLPPKNFETNLDELLERKNIELVVLAGFCRILGANFVKKYKNKIINIHPSLIPAFCGKGMYGIIPHEKALEKGVKITGATVHFVTEEADEGPIILQKAVDVKDDDTPQTLQQRVLTDAEHKIYPQAIKLFAEGRLRVSGRKVTVTRKSENVLVIGSGGREHALAWKLLQSTKVAKVFCAPGNAGTSALERTQNIGYTYKNSSELVEFAKENNVSLAVIGCDDALAEGLADKFGAADIAVFGPVKEAAKIEWSKAFSKDLMKKYKIPTAEYEIFTDYKSAENFIENSCEDKFAVKADGLAAGKGAIVCLDKQTAKNAAKGMLSDKDFGEAGEKIVVESFLEGKEISVLALCDGETIVPFPAARDHKRIGDGDTGLNTGGMGTVATPDDYTSDIAAQCEREIFIPTLNALRTEGIRYCGIIFFGIMLTKHGPKLLEYNARFGDPETQSVLRLLDSDLYDVLLSCAEGRLSKQKVKFNSLSAACVIAASGEYPESYRKGLPIKGIAAAEAVNSCIVFHAGTKLKDGEVMTDGGRVLGVSATGKTLEQAIESAYEGLSHIKFDDMQFRKDIGS